MPGCLSSVISTMNCDRALILAAGRGSRVGHLTGNRPKCLLPLATRPMLDWQLTALREGGISQICLVTGYLANLLIPYRLQSFHNSEWATSNVVSSLLVASRWLEEAASLVAYSDIVYHPDWVSLLRGSPADIAVAYDTRWRELWEARFEHPEVDAESFRESDGLIQEIGQKVRSLDLVQGQYVGLIKITPSGWQQILSCLSGMAEQEVRRLDITALLARLIAAGVSVAAVAIAGRWCEVDTVEDLLLYENRVQSSRGWSHDWR